MRRRHGFTLSVVAFLVALLVVIGLTLAWSTTSDALQTGRAFERERLDQLIASAQDEAAAVAGRLFARASPASPWRDRLLALLEERVKAVGGSLVPADYAGVELEVTPLALPGTAAACQAAGVRLVEAQAHFHGFRPIVYPLDAQFRGASPELGYYREKAMGDADPARMDPIPRDFQGYVTVRVKLATGGAFGGVSRSMESLHDVKVLDVTPPAREFTAFCYGSPPDEAYMRSDLNSGGTLALFPKGLSRLFLRGPLMLAVEDAAAVPHQGGRQRRDSSLSYPERASADWHGWAMIPGPRAIRWPNFDFSPMQLFSILATLFGGGGLDQALLKAPVRPGKDRAFLTLFGLTPQVAQAVLGGQVGFYLPIPVSEELGLALPTVYLAGSQPRGRQTFSICGLTPERFGATATESSIQLFRGLVVHRAESGSYELTGPYAENLDLPRSGYANGSAVRDEDLIVPEPFYYEGGAVAPEAGARDHGIYGVYKLARFNRPLVYSFDLKGMLQAIANVSSFLAWIPLIDVLAPIARAIVSFLDATHMTLVVVGVEWTVDAPPDLETPAELAAALGSDDGLARYFLAPYGLYFDHGKNDGALAELVGDVSTAVFNLIIQRAVSTGLGFIFAIPGKAAPGAAKWGDRLADRMLPYFRTGDGSKGLHTVLRWALRKLKGEGTYRALLRLIARKGAETALDGIPQIGITRLVGVIRDALLGFDETRHGLRPKDFTGLEAGKLRATYPKGFYPPKYRPYGRSAAVEYESFEDLVRARTPAGSDRMVLDGVYRVRRLAYDHPGQTLTYEGRGVIVATGDEGDRPVLSARVVRADPSSYLTLVYENPAVDAPVRSVVALGEDFQGTVCATQGAKPAGSRTRVLGNLVAFNLNKAQIPASADLRVYYDQDRLPLARDVSPLRDWWSVQVSPRVAAATSARE